MTINFKYHVAIDSNGDALSCDENLRALKIRLDNVRFDGETFEIMPATQAFVDFVGAKNFVPDSIEIKNGLVALTDAAAGCIESSNSVIAARPAIVTKASLREDEIRAALRD